MALAVCASAEKVRVLTSFAAVDSLTRQVAGDAAEVGMLLPANASPHDFALSPSDLKKIARADVIVTNGMGVEAFLERGLKAGMKKDALLVEAAGTGAAHSHEHAGHHHEEGSDPHVWLDPVSARKMLENIRDGLKKRDPANAAAYERNAVEAVARLQKLDEDIRAVTAPLHSKRLLTFHGAFENFARRYGFEIVAVVEEFPGKEPTPRHLRELRDIVKAKQVNVIFSEPLANARTVESLARELGVQVAFLDPLETGGPSARLYETVMRKNLETLRSALK
jgi:ABC-type Zn uptake system ZnuABC Zn-binding protein ZnuA